MPQSVFVTRNGGPEVLKLRETPAQPLGPDGVRIRVRAAGVNFADIMMRTGLYPEAPKLPFVPGYEVAGEVLEVATGVSGLRAGDRVFCGTRFGGYTTELVVPAWQVRKIAAGLSEIEAASVPVNFITASVALEDMARVRRGDRVLIHSAAGGVGIAVVQLAKNAGAEVVGLVGSAAKVDAVRALGANEVILNEAWQNASPEQYGDFDVVLDPSGGASLKRSYAHLSPTGRLVCFGAASMVSGAKKSLPRALSEVIRMPFFHPIRLMNENRGVFGLNVLRLLTPPEAGKPHPATAALDRIVTGFEEGRLKTVVGKTFPLERAGEAQAYLQSRANVGKVVLVSRS